MQKIKNKTLTIMIALLLTISIIASINLQTKVSAHSPPWQIPTYAFITAAPNPIGVGQEVHVYFWLDSVYGAAGGTTAIGTNGSTASAALLSNNWRFHDYNLTVVAPDGKITTTIFPVISDPTSSWYSKFTPDQTGIYTIIFTFPGQVYGANGIGYEKSTLLNDVYLPSKASTTLTVQNEPIPGPIFSYPLPQNYWSRPIYGENTDWWAISNNWLGSGAPVPGGFGIGSGYGWQMYKNDVIGPLTPHIMWTRPLQFGGVVGGNPFIEGGTNPNGAVPGAAYFEGTSYQNRFINPIILNGYLYYTEPISFTGPSSGPTNCIDLRTGQLLWSRNDVPALSFGYIFNLWNQDQHGVFPPILFTANFARAFDAYTGEQLFNVTGVPTGTTVMGPSGEQLKFVLTNAGTTANPQWYLAQWNSSKLWQYDINPFTGAGSLSPSLVNASNLALISTNPYPKSNPSYTNTITISADVPINSTTVIAGSHGLTTYDWNTSIPWRNTMLQTPTVVAARLNDIMLLRNGSLPSGFSATGSGASQAPYTYFAINLNASKGQIGSMLWMETYNPPPGNVTVNSQAVDFDNRVFLQSYQSLVQWVGYSLDTGKKLWGPTASQTAFDYYGIPGTTVLAGTAAYGNLYTSSFAGILYCYNILTGETKWTYGNGGQGNSTYGGFNVPYGNYPTMISAISNGVVYLATNEHTIPDPLYKGSTVRAINATTGQEIFQLSNYPGTASGVSGPWAAADGYATFMNGLDNQIYSIGRGPSSTTVTAPDFGLPFGTPVIVRGTVTDVSAGTKQTAQAADFPNGVPVSSDTSMTDWMGYVYQQKPRPSNFIGVEVSLAVFDSNGNFRNIGTATTDESGMFSFSWGPDIPGNYKVIANFEGTNGYWPSYAETSFTVMQATPTASPAPIEAASIADQYFVLSFAAIIVVIIIGFAVLALLTVRKRP